MIVIVIGFLVGRRTQQIQTREKVARDGAFVRRCAVALFVFGRLFAIFAVGPLRSKCTVFDYVREGGRLLGNVRCCGIRVVHCNVGIVISA